MSMDPDKRHEIEQAIPDYIPSGIEQIVAESKSIARRLSAESAFGVTPTEVLAVWVLSLA